MPDGEGDGDGAGDGGCITSRGLFIHCEKSTRAELGLNRLNRT